MFEIKQVYIKYVFFPCNFVRIEEYSLDKTIRFANQRVDFVSVSNPKRHTPALDSVRFGKTHMCCKQKYLFLCYTLTHQSQSQKCQSHSDLVTSLIRGTERVKFVLCIWPIPWGSSEQPQCSARESYGEFAPHSNPLCWVPSREAMGPILLMVSGLTRPGIEPRSPGCRAGTLTTRPLLR